MWGPQMVVLLMAFCALLTSNVAADPTLWLTAINYRRCRHAVPNATWSTTLNTSVYSFVRGCLAQSPGSQYGELFDKFYSVPDPDSTTFNWYSSVVDYNYTAAVYVESARYFTQMVWNSSVIMACAIQYCPPPLETVPFWIAACFFSPKGNIDGQFAANVYPVSRSENVCQGIPDSPSPRPSRSRSPSTSISPISNRPSPSVSMTPNPSPSPKPSDSASNIPSPSPLSGSPSPSPSPVSGSPNPSSSLSPSPSPVSGSPSPSPVSASLSASPNDSPARSPSPIASPSLSPSPVSASSSPSPASASRSPSRSPYSTSPSPVSASLSPSQSPTSVSPSLSPSPVPCDDAGTALALQDKTCVCKERYRGITCSLKCPGPDNITLCSGRGYCEEVVDVQNNVSVSVAMCKCSVWGASGSYCENGCDIVDDAVCSGHGDCIVGQDNLERCTCYTNFLAPNCSLCYPGWFGPLCQDRCPGRSGSGGTWDGCYASVGAGSCQYVSGNLTCVCADGWSGPDCSQGQAGIPVPASVMGDFWLHILNPTAVAGSQHTIKLAGYRTNYPTFLPNMQVKISQTYASCIGTHAFNATVDKATSTAVLPAPSVPGVYSVCAKWRSRFELIVKSDGTPQDLVITAPVVNKPFLGHQTCELYLASFGNSSNSCGCYLKGAAAFEVVRDNAFDKEGLLRYQRFPTVYTGCCDPLALMQAQGNTAGLEWGFCSAT